MYMEAKEEGSIGGQCDSADESSKSWPQPKTVQVDL